MQKHYSFQEIIKLKEKIAEEFEKKEERPWNVESTFIELAKQVGDLAKNIMIYEKYYTPDVKSRYNIGEIENIADELADIFFMLVRIARHYKIDLEEANLEASRKELKGLGKKADF